MILKIDSVIGLFPNYSFGMFCVWEVFFLFARSSRFPRNLAGEVGRRGKTGCSIVVVFGPPEV